MRTEYFDAHSRAVFLRFKETLAPALAQIAPDWILHHIEMERRMDYRDMTEELVMRLVIKPIGSARWGNQNADLMTGNKRLEA